MRFRKIYGIILIFFIIIELSINAQAASAGINLGNFEKWSKIEIPLIGPNSTSTGIPNPFNTLLDVIFTGPTGQQYVVPGFYDGNGAGGSDGNIWKVRFSADETGTWTFISNSSDSMLNGYTGYFNVIDQPINAPAFYKLGRLEYTGTSTNKIRYLKFRDGSYWLKAGCDDPENFLGNFNNYNTLEKRKSAIDYLASKGVNSMYIMTSNIDGDGNDVWPWLGSTAAEAKSNGGIDARFNITKLDEWRQLFEYMQIKGVVPYIILEDDMAWTGFDHGRYYRELIARFGYLPALLFNAGEENNERYSLSTALSYMQQLKNIDPYDHPRGIHNVNAPDNTYVDATQVDFTSIQTTFTDSLAHNQLAVDWITQSVSRNKRVLMVGFDEPRPLMDRKGWWSSYIGGGVWEVHVDQSYDRPMSTWDTAFTQVGIARTFMESLPFWEMVPDNSVIKSGTAFALVKPNEEYALYLPAGGSTTVDLTQATGVLSLEWFNPRTGTYQGQITVQGGPSIEFIAPDTNDWVLHIKAASGAPSANPSASPTTGEAPLTVNFTGYGTDPDGTITSYFWTFGDGSISSLRNVIHTFTTVGNYDAILTVTDNSGNKGNGSVRITVSQRDTTPPAVGSVTISDPNKVMIFFLEPVEGSSATTVSNYAIDNGITISSASLGADLSTVALTTSAHVAGINYTLTVNNVKDRAKIPNTILPNTKISYHFYSRRDVNLDGLVDIDDLKDVVLNFSKQTSPPYPRYDINEDGFVDILDIRIVSSEI